MPSGIPSKIGYTPSPGLQKLINLRAKNKAARTLNSTFKSINKNAVLSTKSILSLSAALAGMNQLKGVLDSVSSSIFNIGKNAIIAAVYATEAQNKFEVVFTDGSAAVRKQNEQLRIANDVVRELAESFGLATETAEELLGTTGDLFAGLELTEEESLLLSKAVIKTAGDLTSFQNIQGGVEEATSRLTKAMMGMTRNLRLLGVTVRRDSREFKDAVAVIQELSGKSKKATESIATLAITIKESPKAMGDFQRTIFEIAQQTRILQGSLKSLNIDLGRTIIQFFKIKDIMILFVGITKVLISLWKDLPVALKGVIILVPILVAGIAALISSLIALLTVAGAVAGAIGILAGTIGVPVLALLAAVAGAVFQFILVIGALIAVILVAINTFGKGETFGERFESVIMAIAQGVKDLVPFIRDLLTILGFLAKIFLWVASSSLEAFRSVVRFILFMDASKKTLLGMKFYFETVAAVVSLTAGFIRNLSFNMEILLDRVINLNIAIIELSQGLILLAKVAQALGREALFAFLTGDYTGLTDELVNNKDLTEFENRLKKLKEEFGKPIKFEFGDPKLRDAAGRQLELGRLRRQRELDKKLGFQGPGAGETFATQFAPTAFEGTAGVLQITSRRENQLTRVNDSLLVIIQRLLGIEKNTQTGRPINPGAGGAP